MPDERHFPPNLGHEVPVEGAGRHALELRPGGYLARVAVAAAQAEAPDSAATMG